MSSLILKKSSDGAGSANRALLQSRRELSRSRPVNRRAAVALPAPDGITLCDDNHSAMKSHEATWQGAPFGGYQPLGAQLGELRFCPVCKSSVVRLVKFTAALLDVLEHLVSDRPSVPGGSGDIYAHSASMLASWAVSNLPGQLGVADVVARLDRSAPSALATLPGDPQPVGAELAARRQRAGLTRGQLGALAGVSASTIRNIEKGRHHPTGNTLRRICGVPALRVASPPLATAALSTSCDTQGS